MSLADESAAGGISRRSVLGSGLAASLALTVRDISVSSRVTDVWFYDEEKLEEWDRFGERPDLAPIVGIWRTLPPRPEPVWHAVQTTWRHAAGAPTEPLDVSLDQLPTLAESVSTPHRRLPADTAFWYRASLPFPTPCVLRIGADDGAQFWVDGQRIRDHGGYFPVPARVGPESDVVIRVLNKAMYGGLETVEWAAQTDFAQCQTVASLRERLDRAVTKLRRWISPSREALRLGHAAVSQPTEATVCAFEHSMSDCPLATIPPVIHAETPDRAILAWETDVTCRPEVAFGIGGTRDRRAHVISDGRFHQAVLDGLPPDTTIEYRIPGLAPRRFRSLPDQGPFTFTVWGDPHIGGSRFRQNVQALRHEPAAFTVGVGDQVVDAAQWGPWEEFFRLGAPLFGEVPAFFMGGNHDYDGCFEDLTPIYHQRYARLNRTPWYAWTTGSARFVVLDPNVQFPTGVSAGSPQHRWLMEELASPAFHAATWRFLFIHQPPFSQGWTEYEGDLPIRELLEPLIERHRIDFVVSGHTHDYERLTRSYGAHRCTFLIVGGAGGSLEDGPLSAQPVMETVQRRHHYARFRVAPDRVTFESIATDTLVLDRFEVTR